MSGETLARKGIQKKGRMSRMTGSELCSFPAIPHILLLFCALFQSSLSAIGGEQPHSGQELLCLNTWFIKQCTWNTWPHTVVFVHTIVCKQTGQGSAACKKEGGQS
ncbi:hypothetical protein NPIL_9361 [Nephila pilipes]|uniref:Spider venom protein n=1 Tax=Nephila pilipes TaxID=299642 RepID=A0A8X6T7Y8_NEPPI|nr:hypothetical protein NPIL_9361 [Nephila pilipes]